MANNIALAKRYLPLLDELYAVGALTSILDAPADMVRESLNAKEILIPKLILQGLGDYSRANGAPAGSVNFAWETHSFNYDRGRKFSVDAQDNMETVDMAFGKLAGQFIDQHVAPEVDATRFAILASKASNVVGANLDKDTALQAHDTAVETMKNLGINESSLIAFISPTMEKYLKQSNLITRQFVTNVGQAVINREIQVLDGKPVVVVPQTRFYSAINMLDGVTVGEEAGGYIRHGSQYDAWVASNAYALGDIIVEGGRIYKATTAGTSGSSKPTFPASGTVADGAGALVWTFQSNVGKNINFILVDANRVMGIKKSTLPAIFSHEENQSADAWLFRYRLYHDMIVPDNAKDGVYVHTVA